MADTTFTAQVTKILAAWLNDINAMRYRANSGISGVLSTMYRSGLSKAADVVSLKDFALTGQDIGDGVTDASTAWAAALAHINTQQSAALSNGYPIVKARLLVPAGDYNIVTGASVATANLVIEGEGRESVRFRIAAGQILLTITGTIQQLDLLNLSTSGGTGVVNHTRTAVNVQGHVNVENCGFFGYTATAIGSLSSDFPYWRIKNNIFRGDATMVSKGIVLSGLTDAADIEGNSFLCNRYGIKLGRGGNNVYLAKNDFTRFQASGASAQVDIWIVPHSSITNSGGGLVATENRFGPENWTAGDLNFLVADEAAGTDAFDKNHATTASTGFWTGFNIYGNGIHGTAALNKGFVYSYTPNIQNGLAHNNVGSGTKHTYMLEYDAGVTFGTDNRGRQSSIIETPMQVDTMFETMPTEISNANNGVALANDMYGVLHGTAPFRHHFQSGYDPGYLGIALNALSYSNASGAGATDAAGGTDAATVTFTTVAGIAVRQITTIGDLVPGRAAWMEFDMKAAAAQAVTQLVASISQTTGPIAVRRFLKVPDHWVTVRMPWVPEQDATLLQVRFSPTTADFSAGVRDQIIIGRVRVYHAHEPAHPGTRFLESSATFNPANLVDGAGETTTVTVTGAALGDYAIASFSLDLQGITVTAYISAADTVSVRFQNESGGALDLASGTLRARVFKA